MRDKTLLASGAMTIERRRARLQGRLQGVGFRPYVAVLARECGLGGFVINDEQGVTLEIEGSRTAVVRFVQALRSGRSGAGSIETEAWEQTEPRGETDFVIGESEDRRGPGRISLAPDLKICPACQADVRDPENRRYGHPFATCTACGPRFTIAHALPYDRERTSMAPFPMCGSCRTEYDDASDRRYHAQALACHACGPQLGLLDAQGTIAAQGDGALERAVELLKRGDILALRGIGGFQLLADATSETAVARLRQRKRRPAKPMAVMVLDLDAARRLASLDPVEAQALSSSAGPIVLVDGPGRGLARSVAPDRARLGLMLATSPLHALLLDRTGVPLVCTSGNLHDEPIAIMSDDALARLGRVADAFLVHDREIERRCDDSVVQIVRGVPRVLRLGRGLAPTRIPLPAAPEPILAMGAHLKHAPALAYRGEAVLWPHVGDLYDPAARDAMEDSAIDLQAVARCEAELVAIDAHPNYATTQWAESSGKRIERVWHHHAHVAAVLAEYGLESAVGLAWDGVGLGEDKTAWGGETLMVSPNVAERIGYFAPFRLPGGDAAARDGRRALAGCLAAAEIAPPKGIPEIDRWTVVTRDHDLSPVTTSVGRLFEAVAALVGVCPRSRYDGEAPSRLEELYSPELAEPYPFTLSRGVLDWRPAMVEMVARRHDPVRVASRFHATLVAMAVAAVSEAPGPSNVVLAGGCFQNRVLARGVLDALESRGTRAYLPTQVPVSDGGLALGQAWVASHRRRNAVARV